jgi:glycosyltransferase involved in cell wall biosynthesis
MSSPPTLQFAVFSFNRGRFLKHCIESIETCVENPIITIYDDNSDDTDTINLLEQLKSRHTVVVPPTATTSKHGGLSVNMQLATSECPDRVNLCYMQDDMQLVRNIDAEDVAAIEACLVDTAAAFVHPVFLKGWNREKDRVRTNYHELTHSYTRKADKSGAGIFFADVMIAKPERLRQVNWQFSTREKTNELHARQLFSPMHFLHSPFLMWLPSVPTYRGKRTTLALRMGEKRHHCGFHPIKTMSTEKVHELKNRPPSQLPVAEDWLELVNDPLPRPWVYEPMHGSRSLKWLNRLELALPGKS